MKDTNSQESGQCPACGEFLPGDSPQGLCAACLMAGALEPTLEHDRSKAEHSSNEPPDIATIRAAFPQFEVIELIGAGGMGSVYKARQPQLDRIVALKILTVADKDDRFAERFQQEAKTLAKLSHPNIVTVYDYGEAEGLYFLLMEFVEGLNLHQVMGASRLAPAQALAIVPPICEALQYAHDLGIVHRDIKPENILMDQAGRVKIADFGIARLLGSAHDDAAGESSEVAVSETPSLTQEMILGTPNYMAPEQGTNPEGVDHRADIYSLGVVFYEMLTGERPGPALTPPSQRVEVDVRLDEVVLRALARQPELRFQSADDFTRTLAQFMTEADSSSDLEQPIETPPAAAPSRRRAWITAGAGVLLAIEGMVAFGGLTELLLMALVGVIAYAWFSRNLIPISSPFSKAGRVLLSMAAVPIIFLVAYTLSQLVPGNRTEEASQNDLIPPESRRFTADGRTVIAVDDGLRTHYVFYYDGNITSVKGMSQGGGRNEPQHWSRSGTMALPDDTRINYERDSSNLSQLSIDGRLWDLRNGAVFQVSADGSVMQHSVYPPLIREDNVAEWLKEIGLPELRAESNASDEGAEKEPERLSPVGSGN
jgi:tRNA A-37 threonylcarbamoyl transferase component Bud32